MKKRIYITASFLAFVVTLASILLFAQGSGTPSSLRVNVDSLGYLVVSAAAQTLPTTSVQFNNARLRTDSSGNLLVTPALDFPAGTGTGTYKPAGLTCQVASVTDASIQNTWNVGTCSLPANMLAVDGDTVRLTASWRAPANTNAREYQAWLAPTTATCSGTNSTACDAGCQLTFSAITNASSNGSISHFYTVSRKGASSQISYGISMTQTSTAGHVTTACSLTSADALNVVIADRNTAAAATSHVNSFMNVYYEPAP